MGFLGDESLYQERFDKGPASGNVWSDRQGEAEYYSYAAGKFKTQKDAIENCMASKK